MMKWKCSQVGSICGANESYFIFPLIGFFDMVENSCIPKRTPYNVYNEHEERRKFRAHFEPKNPFENKVKNLSFLAQQTRCDWTKGNLLFHSLYRLGQIDPNISKLKKLELFWSR